MLTPNQLFARQLIERPHDRRVGVDTTYADDSSNRLRELESENARLRKLVSDLLLQKLAIEESRFRK